MATDAFGTSGGLGGRHPADQAEALAGRTRGLSSRSRIGGSLRASRNAGGSSDAGNLVSILFSSRGWTSCQQGDMAARCRRKNRSTHKCGCWRYLKRALGLSGRKSSRRGIVSRTDHIGRPRGCRRSAGRAASQSFRTRSQGQSGMDRWKAKTIQLDRRNRERSSWDRREQRTIQLGSLERKNDPGTKVLRDKEVIMYIS